MVKWGIRPVDLQQTVITPRLLADSIEAEIEGLMAAWAEAVRQDRRIKSDARLTRSELYDHVPMILEEICELLRLEQSPDYSNSREARVHVYTRYCQGYRARDLVSELSILRVLLLDHMFTVVSRSAHLHGLHSYAQTSRIINLYIDEELRHAVSIYTEASAISPSASF